MPDTEERLAFLSKLAPEDLLEELLATIHGDGGHYSDEHGLAKAVADAEEKWYARSLLESGESAASSAMGDDGTRRQAREVAELFRGFTKSSHRFHDGRPLHLVAAELLEALAASPSPSNEREGK
jgi:hypothetical protein